MANSRTELKTSTSVTVSKILRKTTGFDDKAEFYLPLNEAPYLAFVFFGFEHAHNLFPA